MFYIFILESIGTSELILIGLVALIIFGPRKLPQMARTIGKTMAEFRRSTDEFKKTWEQEAFFDDEKNGAQVQSNAVSQNRSIIETSNESKIISPEIKEINRENFVQELPSDKVQNINPPKIENKSSNKYDWL